MRITFTYDTGDDTWNITKVSLRTLETLDPIDAADAMQDILCDALRAYNRARVRLGWDVDNMFSIAAGTELDGMPQ